MNSELEKRVLQLPKLGHAGMALIEFALVLQSSDYVKRESEDVFRLHYVTFEFPEGKQAIRIHMPVEVIKVIDRRDLNILPLTRGKAFCDMRTVRQLAPAIRYVEACRGNYLTSKTRLDPNRN
jgi:hypothetical protein